MTRKNKNAPIKLRNICTLMFCAMLCLTGCGSQAKKVVKQLTLGEEYMESEDYEKAVEAYEAALVLDEYSIEGYTGLITAMVKNESPAKEIYAKAEEGRAVIQKLASSDEGMSDEQTENAADFYKAVVDAYEDTDADYEAILAVMKEGAETLGKDSDIAEKYTDKIIELSCVDTLLKAAEYIDAGDWQGLADLLDTDEVYTLCKKIDSMGNHVFNYTYMFDGGTTGKGISMYKANIGTEVGWYYGDMVDGKREGQGGWYWCANRTDGLYIENWVGGWSGDAPNGSQHHFWSYDGEVIEEDGTVVNGLCDGVWTFTRTFEIGTVWTGSYTVVNGTRQKVDADYYWISEDNRGRLSEPVFEEVFGMQLFDMQLVGFGYVVYHSY